MTRSQVMKKLVATLKKHHGETTQRILYRAIPSKTTTREADDIISMMEQRGTITKLPPAPGAQGGRPSVRYRLNQDTVS